MRRTRSRLVSLVAAVTLIISMVPAPGASASVLTEGSGAPAVPRQHTTVHTMALEDGIELSLSGLAPDVVSYDVLRSTAEGVEGDKVNGDPVCSATFLDESARPGVTYYYTIRITQRRAVSEAIAARCDNRDVLPQVRAAVIESEALPPQPALGDESVKHEPVRAAQRVSASVAGDTLAAVRALATLTSGVPNSRTEVSGTWSGVVFVRGDVVVPAGKTLTIAPGTKVYFDTASSQTTDTYQTDN